MPEYPRTAARTWSERVYRALLYLYPRALRDEFGDAMTEFFRDRMARARLERHPLSRLNVWQRVAVDIARNAREPSVVDAATFGGRCNIIDDDLVSALVAIPARQVRWIAHVHVPFKTHALDDAAVLHIEARDDASRGQGRPPV